MECNPNDTMQVYLLPFPPSVNRLWRFSGPRMYRTKVYTEWADDAVRHLQQQQAPSSPIDYPVALELAVGRPDARKRDIDNVNKAVLDLLEHVQILENDHHVHDLRSYWSDQVVGVQVIIKNLDSSRASRVLTE